MFEEILQGVSEYEFNDTSMKKLQDSVRKNSMTKRKHNNNQQFSESINEQLYEFGEEIPYDTTMLSKSTQNLSQYRSMDSSMATHNIPSQYEKGDYPLVRSNATSDMRIRIAKREPVRSKYYLDHMKRFKKPPFVKGPRALTLSNDIYVPRKNS